MNKWRYVGRLPGHLPGKISTFIPKGRILARWAKAECSPKGTIGNHQCRELLNYAGKRDRKLSRGGADQSAQKDSKKGPMAAIGRFASEAGQKGSGGRKDS